MDPLPLQRRPLEPSAADSLTPAEQAARRWVVVGCSLALLAFFGWLYVQNFRRIDREGHLSDFRHFYNAAAAMAGGKDPYTSGIGDYVYPPLLAFLYLPLTRLAEKPAAQVALSINVPLMILALFVGARAMLARLGEGGQRRPDFAGVCAVALLACLLCEDKIKGEIQMLQTDVLMLLAFSLALYWLDSRPTLAGTALGFALNIKYLSIIALPYLLLRRRWKAAAATVLAGVFFALLPAVRVGWAEDLRCLRVSTGGLLRWVGVSTAGEQTAKVHNTTDALSVSVTSALSRVVGHAMPRGTSGTPGLIATAFVVGFVAGLILAGVAWLYRWHGLPLFLSPSPATQSHQPFRAVVALEWAGLVVAALAFSPDTNTRHLVLSVLADAAAAAIFLAPRRGLNRWPLVLGLAVMVVCFIMPIRGWTSEGLQKWWFHVGMAGWALLFMYGTLLWVGLNHVKSIDRGESMAHVRYRPQTAVRNADPGPLSPVARGEG